MGTRKVIEGYWTYIRKGCSISNRNDIRRLPDGYQNSTRRVLEGCQMCMRRACGGYKKGHPTGIRRVREGLCISTRRVLDGCWVGIGRVLDGHQKGTRWQWKGTWRALEWHGICIRLVI